MNIERFLYLIKILPASDATWLCVTFSGFIHTPTRVENLCIMQKKNCLYWMQYCEASNLAIVLHSTDPMTPTRFAHSIR